MKPRFLVATLVAAGLFALAACTGANRNLYNAEKLAVDGVAGSTHVLNAWYQNQTNSPTIKPEEVNTLSNKVALIHSDVRKFGNTVNTVDHFRLAYATNSANTNLTAFQAGVTALTGQAQSIEQAVQTLMGGPLFSPLPQ